MPEFQFVWRTTVQAGGLEKAVWLALGQMMAAKSIEVYPQEVSGKIVVAERGGARIVVVSGDPEAVKYAKKELNRARHACREPESSRIDA
jgi:hypothetical protein